MKSRLAQFYIYFGIGVWLLYTMGAFAGVKIDLPQGSGGGYGRSYGGSWGGGK